MHSVTYSRTLGIRTPPSSSSQTRAHHPHQTGLGFHFLPPGLIALLVAQPTHNHSPNSSRRNYLKYKLNCFLPFLKLFRGSLLHEEETPYCLPRPTIGTDPCPPSPASVPALSLRSFHSSLTSLLLFLKHSKHAPTSGPLYLFFSVCSNYPPPPPPLLHAYFLSATFQKWLFFKQLMMLSA